MGFIVTWDVHSEDRATSARLHRFVFGNTVTTGGTEYRYPGFVENGGVWYLGQSVLFVVPACRPTLVALLHELGVPHEVRTARLGSRVRC